MTTELNGPGPIAGEYKGGSSDNLNEQSDNSTPGGAITVIQVIMTRIRPHYPRQINRLLP